MKYLLHVGRIIILSAAIVTSISLAIPVRASTGQAAWGDIKVIPAPEGHYYRLEEVYFKRPHTYKNVYSKIEKTLVAVKVIIYGRDFREKATGPVVWLNRVRANITRVSPDGTIMESYFYPPVKEMQKKVRELKGWELVYLPHDGARWAYIVGPKGVKPERPEDLKVKPSIRTLTEAEWAHAEELASQYGVPLPPRPLIQGNGN